MFEKLIKKLYPMPTPEHIVKRELELAELELLHAESRTELHKHSAGFCVSVSHG